MSDITEDARREALQQVNREGVPSDYDGPVWDTTTLQEEFEVEGFMAPYAVVRRKSDQVRGSVTFTHSPRVYFDFQPSS